MEEAPAWTSASGTSGDGVHGGLWVPPLWLVPGSSHHRLNLNLPATRGGGGPSSGKEGNLLELGALLCLISDLHVILESNLPRPPSLSS